MKSQSTNTTQRPPSKLALALLAGGLAGGCGGSGGEPWTIDPDGYDGLGTETFGLLANPCTINVNTSTMSLVVRDTETLYVTLRAADNLVIASGTTTTGAECAVSTAYKIAITEDSAHRGTEKVFFDYINGTFALGSTTAGVATPGITVVLGAGTPPTTTSSITVRGTTGVDKVYLGSTYTTGSNPTLVHSFININGDTSPDIQFDGVTDVKVSTGLGADIISADGGNGTTGSSLDATITFSAYGGPDADTLTGGKGPSTLSGGDGNDLFLQTATIGADTIIGGKGYDTVDYSVRTTAVNVTACNVCVDTPDPCSCDAPHTACIAPADATYAACTQPFVDAQTDCKTGTGGCSDAEATCEAACPTDSTQAACIAACHTTETSCDNSCDATFATNNAPCVAARTSAYAACDAPWNSCKFTCRTASPCSACTGDDGAANEHDTVGDDVENVIGGKGNDTLSVFYSFCSDQASPTPSVKCAIKGNDGDDTLIGGPFADTLDGGAGNDMLQGGEGSDTLIGGAGIDTVSYADRFNTVKVSLDASRLWTTGQQGEAAWVPSLANNNTTFALENDSIAADIENLTGGAGGDFLRGNASANIIRGGAGDDVIEGGAGNDSLYGDAGNDSIYGGAGNDMLVGGAGKDSMYGGDGDDFLDSSDSPATADLVISCDGVNDFANTAGTSAGTSDALVKDSSDTGATGCEL